MKQKGFKVAYDVSTIFSLQGITMKKGQLLQNSSLRIIVYEHISGGGYAGQSLPTDVLAEGFAMMKGLVADFAAAGHKVTVLVDERITRLNPSIAADFVVPVSYPEEIARFLSAIAPVNDAIYIIAPDTGQTLKTMIALAESTSLLSLNCKSSALSKISDKAELYENLENKGFPIPKTLTGSFDSKLEEVLGMIREEFTCPIILKPSDGVGCSGLSLVEYENQVWQALEKIKRVSAGKRFIIQEYLKGESVSVSLLSNGKKTLALSFNKQDIAVSGPISESRYIGGCVPFDHPLKEDAVLLAEKVVECFPGIRGYVGVDLLLTEEGVFVLDVNPRLTTSYVGLRKVASFNVAQAILETVINGKLPTMPDLSGVACFSKIRIDSTDSSKFRQASELTNVASPPFPSEQAEIYALIIGEGKGTAEAKQKLEEAKKQLLNNV